MDYKIHDWNLQNSSQSNTSVRVEIIDETLRDGLQSPSIPDLPIGVKIEILERLDMLGVHRADIGIPIAGQRAKQDVITLLKHLTTNRLGIRPYCAIRTHLPDLNVVDDIQNQSGEKIEAYSFIGTSLIRQLVENWDTDFLLRNAEQFMNAARKKNITPIFVTEDTTRTPPKVLEPLFRLVAEMGCPGFVICDTVGHSTPEGTRNIVRWCRSLLDQINPAIRTEWHGHNDRGLALANAIAAAEAGCSGVHGTILGIGERTGNTSTDQIIMNFFLQNKFKGDVKQLIPLVEFCSYHMQFSIPENYPLSGKDAFRTATGIHASAIRKALLKGDQALADLVYSAVPASSFGQQQVIEIGHMSGRANIKSWLEEHGYQADEKTQLAILEKAKEGKVLLTGQEVASLINRMDTGRSANA